MHRRPDLSGLRGKRVIDRSGPGARKLCTTADGRSRNSPSTRRERSPRPTAICAQSGNLVDGGSTSTRPPSLRYLSGPLECPHGSKKRRRHRRRPASPYGYGPWSSLDSLAENFFPPGSSSTETISVEVDVEIAIWRFWTFIFLLFVPAAVGGVHRRRRKRPQPRDDYIPHASSSMLA